MNSVKHIDCLIGMKEIPDKSIDMIVTDPPYRVISGGNSFKWRSGWATSVLSKNDGKIFTYNDIKIEDYLPELYRVLKDNSHCYVMTNNMNIQNMFNQASLCRFRFHNLLVWKKNNLTANRWYMKNLEYILFFYKGNAKRINNASTPQTLEINNILGDKIHPTEKPVKLFEILINNSSKQEDIIFDPFAGSGTTAIACINTNRNYILMEKEEKYYNIILDRIKKHTPQLKLIA